MILALKVGHQLSVRKPRASGDDPAAVQVVADFFT